MLSKLNYLFFKKLNLQIFSPLLKIFKNIQVVITGFDVKLKVRKKNIINYLFILKKNSSFLFTMLIDLVVEDFPKKKNRYIVKYFIRSLVYCKTIHLILKVKEYKPIFSLINLYKSSFWLERESWDLFGIFFLNNKDLRRLLTDYGFRGNPLKKDFPLIGYFEIYYNIFFKKIKYKKVANTQKKNNFYNNKLFFSKFK